MSEVCYNNLKSLSQFVGEVCSVVWPGLLRFNYDIAITLLSA